jgi:endonuclease YncB( thermonuclease family)
LLLLLLLLCSILLPIASLAAQDEAYGIVTNVVDGDTFDLAVEKGDARISSGVERVRLADVNSPEIDTTQGPSARDFAFAVLMNKRVYLDIDDQSSNGRDTYGRLIAVVYLTGFYGQPLASPNFNRMLVDSGHAKLENFTDNEFNPANWWPEESAGRKSPTINVEPLEGLFQNLLGQLQQSAGQDVDKAAKDAWGKLKSQL